MAVTVKITLQDSPVQISAQVDDGAAVLAQVKDCLLYTSDAADE